MDNKELVFNTLAKSRKPLKNSEIAEFSGLEKGAVEKAIKVLKTEDRVFSPQRCFWQCK
ncbi:MAG: transcriptional regulator [Bacteroidales bacterium]|nr:transcriptional regulator [Bacteroidales bacterium]